MENGRGYALVTGASQGLGAALALELARHGFGLLLTSRREDALADVGRQAGALNGGRVQWLAADLFEPDAPARITAWAEGLGVPVTCLVNNAGQGLWGLFDELSLEEQQRMMRLNMAVPVELAGRLLPRLKQSRRGYVLNISSMSAYTAMAGFAVYAASKSFVLRWSRALRGELSGSSVTVTAVCPGSIITGFTERAGMQALDHLARRFGTGPVPVARAAVKAMLKGKAEVVPGLMNLLTARIQGCLPDRLNERLTDTIYLRRLPRKR